MKILVAFILTIISLSAQAQETAYYENLIPDINGQRELSFHFNLQNKVSDNEILQVVKEWLTQGFIDHLLGAKQIAKNKIEADAEFSIHHKKLILVAGNIVRYHLVISSFENNYTITFSNIKLKDENFNPIYRDKKEHTLGDVINGCYNEKKLSDLNNSRVAIQIIYDRFKEVAGSLRSAELNFNGSIQR